jgi:NADH-quinone oxidoreductase subunit M
MGGYGLIRLAIPLFPEAALYFAPLLATLSVIAIVYGALVAMVQPDMKKLVAYSSVSHMGFVILGIAAINVQGLQGASYQMLAHGVSTGALFCLVGMLSDRRHTRLIAEFGGLKSLMPRFTAVALIITLSSIGLPGMNGFIGEFLIMLGAFKWDPRFVVIAALGVILSAVYMLWMFQRVFYGKITNEHNRGLRDLSFREWAIVGPLAAAAIGMGVVPNVFLRPMEPALQRIVDRVQSRQPLRVEAVLPKSMKPKPRLPGSQRPKSAPARPQDLTRPQDPKAPRAEVVVAEAPARRSLGEEVLR